MIDPINPQLPGPPEPRQRDWTKMGAIWTIVGAGIAFMGVVVAVVGIAITAPPQALQSFWRYLALPAETRPSTEPAVPGESADSPVEKDPTVSPDAGVSEPESPKTGGGPETTDLPAESGEELERGEEPPASTTNHSASSARNRSISRRWIRQVFGGRTGEEPGLRDEEGQETIEETPNPSTPSEDGGVQDAPLVSNGFQQGINVSAYYADPTGPRIRGELTLPQLPADALRSLAPGKRLIVRVRVEADGTATVTRVDGSWLPEAVRQRVCDDLESRPWIPKADPSGSPRASDAAVIFKWRG